MSARARLGRSSRRRRPAAPPAPDEHTRRRRLPPRASAFAAVCLLVAGAILLGAAGVRAVDAVAPVRQQTGVVRSTEREERLGRRGRRVVDHVVRGDLDDGGTFRITSRALYDATTSGDPVTIETSRVSGEPSAVRGPGFQVDLASGGWFWSFVALLGVMGAALAFVGALELRTSRPPGWRRWAVLGLGPIGLVAGGSVGVAIASGDSEVRLDPAAAPLAAPPPELIAAGGTVGVDGWELTVAAAPVRRSEQVVVEVRLANVGVEPAFPARLGMALVAPNGARYRAELLGCDAPRALPLAREVQPGAEVAGAVCFPAPPLDADVYLDAGGVELALETR